MERKTKRKLEPTKQTQRNFGKYLTTYQARNQYNKQTVRLPSKTQKKSLQKKFQKVSITSSQT